MESNYSWKRTEDIEIDLIDLLRRLCRQWKQILVCAVAFAVLAGGYSYARSGEGPAVTEPEETEEIELDEKEQRGVTAALRQEAEVRGLEEYLENSVLMQIDPYHKNSAVLLFAVNDAEGQSLQGITESYLNFVLSGGAADAILASGGWEMDKACLSELINASSRTSSGTPVITTPENVPSSQAVLYVRVTGLDEEMTEKLSADMQSALEGYSATVKSKAGAHTLSLIGVQSDQQADSDLQARQHSNRALLTSYTDGLTAMTDAFTEDQLAVYQEAVGIEEKEDGDADEAEASVSRGISKKYVVLGLAGGIFIYCCIYACLYLFRDTLKSTEEIKGLYTFPFYGGVSLSGKAKMPDAQRKVYDQEIAQILNRVRLACKNQEIGKLCIASDFSFGAQEKESIEGIVKQLNSWGIDTVIAENASSDTTVWDTLAEIGTVLMVCKIGTTTHRIVDEEMSFYQENDIAVLGAVAFTLQ